jgi:hypothetical protein
MSNYRNRNNRARKTASRFARRPTIFRRAQEERQPGQTSQTLRRRMGDALADLFDEFGPDIYSATTLALKDVILQRFQQGFEQLDSTIKEELGQRGVEESRQHIRGWTNEIVEDVNHFGLDEVAAALEDYVGTLAAEFQQPEADEGDELLEVDDDEPVEEVDEQDVEEVEPEAPAEEPAAEAPAGEGELNLEDLGLELPAEQAAARFGPLGGRRRVPRRAPRRRSAVHQKGRRLFGSDSARHAKEYFAIVQTCGPVWGIGRSCEEALADMNQYLAEHEALSMEDLDHYEGKHGLCDRTFCLPCTKELYDEVEQYGGDLVYEIDDGVATLPVDRREAAPRFSLRRAPRRRSAAHQKTRRVARRSRGASNW